MESIRIILRRNGGGVDDLERQQATGPSSHSSSTSSHSSTVRSVSPRPIQEMEERSPNQRSRFRFSAISRPTIPSFFGGRSTRSSDQQQPRQQHHQGMTTELPRPTSSYYSDQGLESPKSPRFSLGLPHLPSTRLHLPNLARTWTQGSNGPPTRPGTDDGPRPPIVSGLPPMQVGGWGGDISGQPTQPAPAVPADHIRGHHLRTASSRSGFQGADPAEAQLAGLAEDGRRRRRRRRGQHERGDGERSHHRHDRRRKHDRHHHRRRRRRREHGEERQRRATPKRFLLCFPWVRSRRTRSQILKCFVSGTFLVLILTIYLSLTLTKNINNSEFTIVLILIILFATIIFCHGLIRLCMLLLKPSSARGQDGQNPDDEERRRRVEDMEAAIAAHVYTPGGYAIPREPIRVVMTRDEEAAGIESDATKTKPPAYGLWRESVRVDPNRFYWQRNEEAPAMPTDDGVSDGELEMPTHEAGEGGSRSDGNSYTGDGSSRSGLRRPPSYVSEDGVSYVVDAQPRSMAPTTGVTLPQHPSEVGRTAQPYAW